MSSSPGSGFWILVASMAAGMYEIWRKGRHVPRRAWRMSFHAIWRAKRAEIIRLAKSNQAVQVPGLSRVPEGERLMLAIPVFLYESRPMRSPYPIGMRLRREILWRHVNRAGAQVITMVDSGTLTVTHQRIIFTSSRRRREFPLGEVTHISAKTSAIALARRGVRGASYFTGIDATKLSFRVEPEGDEMWPARYSSASLSGQDIQAMVKFLQLMPPSKPA